MSGGGPAIRVRKACKAYSTNKILENLDLTVKSGTIYGLLGASGCGKTTLLSCIVGVNNLDNGDIHVFGTRPGSGHSTIPGPGVGYMCQDIALHDFFTVSEILNYYGRIYGLQNIKEREEELLKFLHLSEFSGKSICNMSGGQQRRVSLAIALFHKPPLLILDEPTVGVDPLLRQSIWQHLVELVAQSGTTILITTHYIEEARCSDTVGILRKGHLISEDNPDTLMSTYRKTTLEDVVLQLCHQQDFKETPAASGNETDELFTSRDADEFACSVIRHRRLSNASQFSVHQPVQESRTQLQSSWYTVVAALAWKNLLKNVRFKVYFIFQMLLPVIQVVVIQHSIGTEPKGLRLGVTSESFLNGSFCPPHFNFSKGCLDLSENQVMCGYLKLLENDFRLSFFHDVDSALKSVHSGKTVGYLDFPANFSEDFKNRLVYGRFAGEEVLSEIGIRLDRTNAINANFVVKGLSESFLDYMKEIVENCGDLGDVSSRADIPVKFHAAYGTLEGVGITLQLQPAIIILIMFLLAGGPMLFHVTEKVQGLADRDAVAGVRVGHSIVSSVLSCSVITGLQALIFLVLVVGVYGMRVHGSWLLFLLFIILICVTGMSFGFMLASIVSHEMEFALTYIGLIWTVILSSGGLFPVTFSPLLFRIFCHLLPVTFPVRSLIEIVLKGGGLLHPNVYPGLISSLVWIAVCVLVSAVSHRRYTAKK